MTIKALKASEEIFSILSDFSYQPHYIGDLEGFDSLSRAYLDASDSASA